MSTTDLTALQHQLHSLIKSRCREFHLEVPAALPDLHSPLPTLSDKVWFPVDGMYGGFAYWRADSPFESGLFVESWSRVAEGSGQRHLLLPNGYTLLEDSIC